MSAKLRASSDKLTGRHMYVGTGFARTVVSSEPIGNRSVTDENVRANDDCRIISDGIRTLPCRSHAASSIRHLYSTILVLETFRHFRSDMKRARVYRPRLQLQ